MMIHQTISVGRSLFRLPASWGTSTRSGVKHPFPVLLKFHAIEAMFGVALIAGIIGGSVSLYLLPIAASLTLAPILSHLSATDLGDLTSGPCLF